MFEYDLLERARRARKHIVLPEGDDDRILRAAATLLARDVADLTILGEEIEVRARAIGLGLDISRATRALEPRPRAASSASPTSTQRLRAHKGVTLEQARDTVQRRLVLRHDDGRSSGLADGMVSGAAHTTAHTIRPAVRDHQDRARRRRRVERVPHGARRPRARLRRLRGRARSRPPSSSPTSRSRRRRRPRSSASSRASRCCRTRRASRAPAPTSTRCARRPSSCASARPSSPVEGPIQYDAAADAAVARTKLPESDVAGRATVFIFPDLNTGNNTYKAVQRSPGAVAIGPVLQGLRKPINDLSRGALVQDIVNTVAITAIQAADAVVSVVLVVNSGSSSLKYQLIDVEAAEPLASGLVERIGEARRARHAHPSTAGSDDRSTRRTDATRRSPTTTRRSRVMLEAFAEHGPSLDEHPPDRRRPPRRARRRAVLRADGRHRRW